MSMQLAAVRAFHAIPMFAALTDEETFEILRICRAHSKPAGTVLFRQGQAGHSAFVIESGTVDIVLDDNSRRAVLARLGPGDVLGELALIDPGLRSATAVVVSDSVLYEIPGEQFNVLREQMSPAVFKVVRHLTRIVCQRLRVVNSRIEAQLAGKEPPPLVDPKHSQRPASQAESTTVVEPDPNESSGFGVVKRLLGRFWGTGSDS